MSNLAVLLRSRDIAPKALSEVVSDSAEAWIVLRTTIVEYFSLLHEAAKNFTAPSVAIAIDELERYAREAGDQAETILTEARGKTLNAAKRLHLERFIFKNASKLEAFLWLCGCMGEALKQRGTVLDVAELMRQSQDGDQPRFGLGKKIELFVHEVDATSLYSHPRIAWSLFVLAAGIIADDSQSEWVKIRITRSNGPGIRTGFNPGKGEGYRLCLAVPDTIPPSRAVTVAISEILGGRCEFDSPTSKLLLIWNSYTSEANAWRPESRTSFPPQ